MKETTDETRLLIKKDVAEMLRVSIRTLDNMIKDGTFPKPDRMIGRHPRWKGDTISGWIKGG